MKEERRQRITSLYAIKQYSTVAKLSEEGTMLERLSLDIEERDRMLASRDRRIAQLEAELAARST